MKISFEFFPPRSDDARERLDEVITELNSVSPEYFSVTFGAGGTTRESTSDTVAHIIKTHQSCAVPHISCIGSEVASIHSLLQHYQDMGVKRLVTLRGDIPSGVRDIGDFHHAIDLVRFIREKFADSFHLTVAGYPEKHPQAQSYASDMDYFIEKLQLADNAITQYFYNIDSFLYFRDAVSQVSEKNIIPGIMPITNFDNVVRFSAMCGAEIPRWLNEKMHSLTAEDKIKFGYEVVQNLCHNLKAEGVEEFHFYSMNNTHPNLELAQSLL